MNKVAIVCVLVSSLLVLSCGDSKTANGKGGNAEVKKGVTPIADAEIAVLEMETSAYGTITMELYSNIAPKAVARFKELAKEGVYDGVTFHRINESVIQSGDPNSKDADPANDGKGKSTKPNVEAEFSDLKYESGIVGAARNSGDNNSANSQFFITLKRVQDFDTHYTIFGKVIDGMNNVRTISGVQPKEGERPVEPIRIKHISFITR